jgi:serine/threonine protein kinase
MDCTLLKQLGKGVQGEVHTATVDGTEVTVKLIKNQGIERSAEYDILFRLNSPYLCKGFAIYPPGKCHEVYSAISIERLDGTVHDLGGKRVKLTPLQIKSMFFQLVTAVSHLNRGGYYHLDLHRGNVMYKIDMNEPPDSPLRYRYVLIDFGLVGAVDLLNPTHPVSVKLKRLHPKISPWEILMTDSINYVTDDLWSLTIDILCTMGKEGDIFEDLDATDFDVARETLFKRVRSRNLHREILSKFPEDMRDIVSITLSPIPSRRLSAEVLKSHPYFDEVRDLVIGRYGDRLEDNSPKVESRGGLSYSVLGQLIPYVRKLSLYPGSRVESIFIFMDLVSRSVIKTPPVHSLFKACLYLTLTVFDTVDADSAEFKEMFGFDLITSYPLFQVLDSCGCILRGGSLYSSIKSKEEMNREVKALFKYSKSVDLKSESDEIFGEIPLSNFPLTIPFSVKDWITGEDPLRESNAVGYKFTLPFNSYKGHPHSIESFLLYGFYILEQECEEEGASIVKSPYMSGEFRGPLLELFFKCHGYELSEEVSDLQESDLILTIKSDDTGVWFEDYDREMKELKNFSRYSSTHSGPPIIFIETDNLALFGKGMFLGKHVIINYLGDEIDVNEVVDITWGFKSLIIMFTTPTSTGTVIDWGYGNNSAPVVLYGFNSVTTFNMSADYSGYSLRLLGFGSATDFSIDESVELSYDFFNSVIDLRGMTDPSRFRNSIELEYKRHSKNIPKSVIDIGISNIKS